MALTVLTSNAAHQWRAALTHNCKQTRERASTACVWLAPTRNPQGVQLAFKLRFIKILPISIEHDTYQ
jgi:hypothetical protein